MFYEVTGKKLVLYNNYSDELKARSGFTSLVSKCLRHELSRSKCRETRASRHNYFVIRLRWVFRALEVKHRGGGGDRVGDLLACRDDPVRNIILMAAYSGSETLLMDPGYIGSSQQAKSL